MPGVKHYVSKHVARVRQQKRFAAAAQSLAAYQERRFQHMRSLVLAEAVPIRDVYL